jgi:hypothetical protein
MYLGKQWKNSEFVPSEDGSTLGLVHFIRLIMDIECEEELSRYFFVEDRLYG